MHEYPVAMEIVHTAEEEAKKNNAKSVSKINLVVGEFSGYLADSIKLYFDVLAKGTMCEKAELEIENIKPKLKCAICGELFERKPFEFECPKCGGVGEPTEIGREFYVKSIEVET